MTVRIILKMGDPRLLRVAQPVQAFGTTAFGTPELATLVADMHDTMVAANGAGLAAPQIGVDLQLVIFGFQNSQRYPDAPLVPLTVLINPQITTLGSVMEDGWVACRCRACAARCRAMRTSATPGLIWKAGRSTARPRAFMPAWCSMNAIT